MRWQHGARARRYARMCVAGDTINRILPHDARVAAASSVRHEHAMPPRYLSDESERSARRERA